MGVHEPALRAAMERLLAGQALHTDGRLTVKNLAAEAAVPRATLYRSEADLMAEYERRAKRLSTDHGDRAPTAQLERLRARAVEAERCATSYREELARERQ